MVIEKEYPQHTIDAEEQIDFARTLLQKLAIDQVILLGGSDGGVYAQIFAKKYPFFQPEDFSYLRGKIQVIIPDQDIFKKEDQQRLEALFKDLDAEILHVPGGHLSMVVQIDDYLKNVDRFLNHISAANEL